MVSMVASSRPTGKPVQLQVDEQSDCELTSTTRGTVVSDNEGVASCEQVMRGSGLAS